MSTSSLYSKELSNSFKSQSNSHKAHNKKSINNKEVTKNKEVKDNKEVIKLTMNAMR
jgi:hypothetical protein